jgi:SAM-dependent methyltransferase
VGKVIGVDFSSESVGILKARCQERRIENIEAHVADLRQLPIADNSCDAAISIQVIQHIPSDAWRLDALKEAARILKPGGRFAFTVYQFGTMIRDSKEGDFKGRGYRFAFTPEEVLEVLAQAGFGETRVTGALHLPHVLLRYLPGSFWPLEAAMSRAGIMTRRATYLLGYGVKRT